MSDIVKCLLDKEPWLQGEPMEVAAAREIERLREVMKVQGELLDSGTAGHRGVIIGQRLLNAIL